MLALRIDQNGSDVMEFRGEGGVKYKTDVMAERVLSDTGEFGGYKGQDLEVHGDGQPVCRSNSCLACPIQTDISTFILTLGSSEFSYFLSFISSPFSNWQ